MTRKLLWTTMLAPLLLEIYKECPKHFLEANRLHVDRKRIKYIHKTRTVGKTKMLTLTDFILYIQIEESRKKTLVEDDKATNTSREYSIARTRWNDLTINYTTIECMVASKNESKCMCFELDTPESRKRRNLTIWEVSYRMCEGIRRRIWVFKFYIINVVLNSWKGWPFSLQMKTKHKGTETCFYRRFWGMPEQLCNSKEKNY